MDSGTPFFSLNPSAWYPLQCPGSGSGGPTFPFHLLCQSGEKTKQTTLSGNATENPSLAKLPNELLQSRQNSSSHLLSCQLGTSYRDLPARTRNLPPQLRGVTPIITSHSLSIPRPRCTGLVKKKKKTPRQDMTTSNDMGGSEPFHPLSIDSLSTFGHHDLLPVVCESQGSDVM